MKIVVLIVVLISLLSSKQVFSQQVESLHSVKIGFPGITYSYEHALGKQFSINVEASVNWGWQYNNYSKSTTITFSPIFQLEPRYYYNVNRRFNDKRFINNSASFFSISSGIRLESFNETSSDFFIMPKWGFRRAMGKHFIFETQIGGGIKFDHGSSQFMPGLDIKFGYIF